MSKRKARCCLSLFIGVFTFLGGANLADAKDYPVATSAAFRAALIDSVPGDTITLTSGLSYIGTFVLPNKAGTGVITIRSSGFGSGAPAGTRVKPADASRMAKVLADKGNPAFRFAAGAHHYRLTGLEITPTPNSYTYDFIQMGNGDTQVGSLPSFIEIDHCFIHGDPAVGGKRGISANGVNINIHDNYISDIKSKFQDSQTINAWNGPGPITITNNYLEAAGENVMFGGANPSIPGVIPSDITIQHNHFTKPLGWKGQGWIIKNLLEFKTGRRVKVTANIFENSWPHAQRGQAFVITPRIERTSWIVVEDITFEYNIIHSTNQLLLISGVDDAEPSPRRQRTSNVTFRNNLIYNVAEVGCSIVNSPKNLIFDHNTIIQGWNIINFDAAQPQFGSSGFKYTNNLVAFTGYGVFGSGKGAGTAALNYYTPGWVFARNVFFGQSPVMPQSGYPADNYFAMDEAEVGFTTTGDTAYEVASTSPYANFGLDGKTIGADVAAVKRQTKSVLTGSSTQPNPPKWGRPPTGSIGLK